MHTENYNNRKSHQKTRLKSLKMLKNIQSKFDDFQSKKQAEKIIQILQKKLAKDSLKETQPMAQLRQQFNDQEKQKVIHQNKLYLFFLKNISQSNEKVQRQKLNCWQKQFNFIKAEIKKKIDLNQMRKKQGEKSIQKKLKQLHSLFQQVKSLKSMQNSLKLKKNLSQVEDDSLQPDNQIFILQKKQIIRQNINELKRQIKQMEEEVDKIKTVDFQIINEWKGYLKLILKNNFYFLDGVKRILVELKLLKELPLMSDLPDVLDQHSKKYLLKVYVQLSSNNNQSRSPSFDTRKRVKSNIQTNSLLKKDKLKDIYSQTRDMVTCLLKDSKWKKLDLNLQEHDKKQLKLPQIHKNRIDNDNQKNQQKTFKHESVIRKSTAHFGQNVKPNNQQQNDLKIQIQRINTIYGESYEAFISKRLLFGVKM